MADGKTFGKTPPRSLDTFGVAGLLGEKSKVFYSSIFTTKHVGRVTDLIAAKLLDEGLDELRLRALLLFGVFEVFRNQSDSQEGTSKQRLVEPLVVECGVDDDKIAIGISFSASEERFPKFEGLAQRISSGKPEGVFEVLLSEIYAHSHWTVVRGQAGIRRVEIVALLGIPGKIAAEALSEKAELQVVEIPKEQKADPPKVKAYIELGDLDYTELLKEDVSVKDEESPATGEILMQGLKESEDSIKVRGAKLMDLTAQSKIGGKTDEDGSSIRVGGQAQTQEGSFKVSGGGAVEGDVALLVKGGGQPASSGDYAVKSYGVPAAPGDSDEADGKSLRKNKSSESEDAAAEGDEEEGDGDSSNAIQDVIEKVKKAWPFRFGRKKKAKEEEEQEEEEEEEEDEEAEKGESEGDEDGDETEEDVKSEKSTGKEKVQAASTKKKDAKQPVEAEEDGDTDEDGNYPTAAIGSTQPIKISTADIEKEAQKLSREIETGIDKTITRAQGEAADLKKEMGSTRAKRWVDGLMTELVAEKARLGEASKALNASIRQKEIEFRNKEQLLTEELRRRDDLIRQKTNALNRAKDQVSQAAMSAERAKSAKAGAADDAHYKQKYGLVQKMLTSAKDENTELVEKVEDLKNQLMSAQLSSSKRNGPSATDFTALQSKYERSVRQSEEFKKANQQLLDKLAEAKKERAIPVQEDVKKRLEAAMKLATTQQRDAEKVQLRVEEMQREQIRLQSELTRTTQELKAARVASAAAAAKTANAPVAAKPSSVGTGVNGGAVTAAGTANKPAAAKAAPVPGASAQAAGAAAKAAPTAAAQATAKAAAAPQAVTAGSPAKTAAPVGAAKLSPVAAAPSAVSTPASAANPASSGTATSSAAAAPTAASALTASAPAKPGTGGKSNPPKAA